MFLGKAENKLRFTYAASFGKITAENSKWLQQDKYRVAMGRFSQVSVRENSSVIKLRENFNIESVQISDPCFLFTRDDFKDKFNIKEPQNDKSSEYVFVYTLTLEGKLEHFTLNHPSSLRFISSKPISSNQERLIKLNKCLLNLGKPPLPDFLRELSNSSLVITDSFHGVVLSLIFERDFRIVINEERGADRILDLLEKFGLTSRIISNETEWENNVLEPIDWKSISGIREKEMKRGKDFLDFNLPN
jgi:polysaccharide pyruvyl transferase WcaK-like protein